MRRIVLLVIGAAFMLSCIAMSADGPPAPSPAPPAINKRPRPVRIGPKDWEGPPQEVARKITLVGVLSKEAQPTSVDFLVDDTPVGSAKTRPFMLEFDTTTIPDGDYTVKAVGKDSAGKDIWSAVTRVRVNNSSPSPTGPRVPKRDRTVPGTPGSQPPAGAESVPGASAAAPPPAAPPLALDKLYTSKEYGFSIRYPGAWTATDETSKHGESAGDFWLAFGENPVERAPVVVNVHRRKLQATTDANIFAKYNDYVLSWRRDTMLGCPVFTTTTGTPASGGVTHRAILIKDHCAWMFNCVDKSGRPKSQSADLFHAMIKTLETAPR